LITAEIVAIGASTAGFGVCTFRTAIRAFYANFCATFDIAEIVVWTLCNTSSFPKAISVDAAKAC